MRPPSGPLATLVSAFVLGVACAGTNEPGPVDGGGATVGAGGLTGDVSCVDDPRVSTYTAGLTQEGERGMLSFRLESSEPAPPAKGGNDWEVSVLDTDGSAVDGVLSVDLTMPDHGHGTQVEPVVSYDAGTGRFAVAPVYLFMAGVWRVTLGLSASDSAKLVDRASFYFCIEG